MSERAADGGQRDGGSAGQASGGSAGQASGESAGPGARHDDGRFETPAERADRNFIELLQELRVAQTGVQILFAFLLAMPLQARFGELDRWQRGVFVAALLSAAIAAATLIAPVAYHRAYFRHRMKDELVHATSRFAVLGLVFLGTTVCCAMGLVLDLVLGRAWALVIAGGFAVALLVVWAVAPITVRRRHGAARL
jgi:hypothetical protein